MSIVPDKKNGKLTGRFRVQLMVNYQLYRRRVDTIGQARSLERDWLALKAQGLTPPPTLGSSPTPAPRRTPVETPSNVSVLAVVPTSRKLSQAIQEAQGRIWTKPKTEAANETNLRIMLETMGDVDLNGIDTAWVLGLKEALKDTRKGKRGEPLKDASINRFLATLSKFLKYSVDKGWRTVEALPKMEYGDEDEGRIRWFSAEEEAQLYSLLSERCAKVVGVDIRSGLRRTEILSLEPDQIGTGCVHIWKTKSGSPRTVPLAEGDEETLRWLTAGNMPTDGELRGEWERARVTMGLAKDEDFVFHACRHTYATRAVKSGVPIRVLQKLMGHKTIQMTERYAHVHDEMLMDARDRMFAPAAEAA